MRQFSALHGPIQNPLPALCRGVRHRSTTIAYHISSCLSSERMPKPGFGPSRREAFREARFPLFPDSVPPVSPLLVVRLCNLKSAISNYRQVSRSMGSLPFASRRSTGVPPWSREVGWVPPVGLPLVLAGSRARACATRGRVCEKIGVKKWEHHKGLDFCNLSGYTTRQ